MGVRAKFRCVEKSQRWAVPGPQAQALGEDCQIEVKLQPVYEGDVMQIDGHPTSVQTVAENRIFGIFTPAGQIAMLLRSLGAAAQFEVGRAYYVDFTPADG